MSGTVLHILGSDFAGFPAGGGAALLQSQLALQTDMLDVHIVGLGDERTAAHARSRTPEMHFHAVLSIGRLGRVPLRLRFLISLLLRLPRLLREVQPDVVVAHMPEALLALRATRWPGRIWYQSHAVESVMIQHSRFRVVRASKVLVGLNAALLRCACRRVERYIIASQAIAADARQFVPEERIFTGPPIPPAPQPNNLELPRGGLLWVGRLSTVKDPLAALAVAEQLPEVRLTLVGDGELRASVDGYLAARPTLARRVSRQPHLARGDLYELMRRSAALLVTSRSESFGMVAIEALAHGCVVVGPPVGVLPELHRLSPDVVILADLHCVGGVPPLVQVLREVLGRNLVEPAYAAAEAYAVQAQAAVVALYAGAGKT